MGELGSVLDGLACEDLFPLGAAELLGRVHELVAAQHRLAAELARTVRRAELAQAPEHDGHKNMAGWLRGHTRLAAGTAFALVRAGRTLDQLPAVAARAAAGELGADALAALAPVAHPENVARAAAQSVDLPGVDATLAAIAATETHQRLRQVVAHYLARLDPDGPEPDPTQRRSLSLSKHADGSVTGRFDLDPVGGEKLQAALESYVQADRPAGDPRSRAQQLGDALVQLADTALGSGGLPVLRTVKPHVGVLIPLADLADPATGPATGKLSFGAQISAATARWLACDGNITRIVIGPEGQPLDLGRSHRVVPPHLRRAVETRDVHCVFTGCDAPSYWCDVHHVLHWIDDGETSLDNSALLCERHHTQVHHGFRIERQPDGRWRTWRPDGTEILVPRPLRV
jgi:hypothetical protein